VTATTVVQDVRMSAQPKPRLRGRLHQAAFFACIPAGLALIWVAPGLKARVGAIVYAISLLLQFGASSMYHIGDWSDKAYLRMRRLDHTMIFVLIAGTYTPMCLVALHGRASWAVLTLVWAGAAVGILTKLYRIDLHVLSGIMYIGLGWLAAFVLPALARSLSGLGLAMLISGGVLYTVGALALATHHPNPWPKTFGYHEVWHTGTILAAACLYTAILLLYLGA
jgi:hemolysin III